MNGFWGLLPFVQQIRSYKFQNDVQTVLMLTLIQFYVSYTLDTNFLQNNLKKWTISSMKICIYYKICL